MLSPFHQKCRGSQVLSPSPAFFCPLPYPTIWCNRSGYWSRPIYLTEHQWSNDPTTYRLEANTPDKYKMAGGTLRSDDSNDCRTAWQKIVKKAGLNSLIHLQ